MKSNYSVNRTLTPLRGARAGYLKRYASATNIIGAHMKGILLVGLGGFIGSVTRDVARLRTGGASAQVRSS